MIQIQSKQLPFLIVKKFFLIGGGQNTVGCQETLLSPPLLLYFRHLDIHIKTSLKVTLENCFSKPPQGRNNNTTFNLYCAIFLNTYDFTLSSKSPRGRSIGFIKVIVILITIQRERN